jgi:hypothetical protein
MRALRAIAFSALLFTASSTAAFAAGDGGGYSMPGAVQSQTVRGDGGGYSVPTRGDGGGYSVPTRGDGGGYAQPRDNFQPVRGDGGGYSSPVIPTDQQDFERWV